MSRRNYANSASVGTITGVLNNTDTTTTVTLSSGSPSGWPSTPCTAAINLTLADEEVVLVTAISGPSVTFTRGYNGSTTRAHTAGATLTHASAAIDFDEANAHVQATTGIHGVTGAVVGTSDIQTLTNKTLTTPTIGSFSNANHTHSGTSMGGNIPESSVTNLVSDLAVRPLDTAVVHNTTNETIAGNKTFSGTTALAATTVGGTLSVAGTTTMAAASATSVAASSTLTVGGQNVMSVAVGDAIIASGQPTITTDGSGRVTINYGHTFTDVPVVLVTTNTTNDARQMVNVVGRNASQFVAEVYHDTSPATGVTLIINWIAIGS